MPIISGGGGGGSSAAVGGVLTLSANTTVSSAQTIPYDTSSFDSSTFVNTAGHDLVVPAGLGGLYQYGVAVIVAGTAGLTSVRIVLTLTGSADNSQGMIGANGTVFDPSLTVVGVERMAAGDTVSAAMVLTGAASATVVGAGNAGMLWLYRIGT